MTDAVRRPPARRPVLGAVLVLGAASLWATFGIFAKYLYAAGFEPMELASVRTTVACAAVALLALPRMLRHSGARVPLRAMPLFVLYGIVGFALFGVVFLAALERTDVGTAVALLYTAPAFVVLMSTVVWKERLSAARGAALLMVLAGVALVTGALGALLRGDSVLSGSALALGIASGAGYAVYTMFSKVAAERHGSLMSLFWCFLFATAVLVLFASPLTPFLRSPEHTLLLLGLGIVPTVLPYGLYLVALRELPASTAAMLASLEPAVAAILAALLLGERMGALQVGGVVLIVAAAVLLAGAAASGADATAAEDSAG